MSTTQKTEREEALRLAKARIKSNIRFTGCEIRKICRAFLSSAAAEAEMREALIELHEAVNAVRMLGFDIHGLVVGEALAKSHAALSSPVKDKSLMECGR